MGSYTLESEARRCNGEDEFNFASSTFGFPPSAPTKSILKRHDAAAKSIIESTLRMSAGILSEFTENTISQSSICFNNILSPERFGFNSNHIIPNNAKPHNVINVNSTGIQCNVAGRRKPDITKLPSSIVDILREDSNSSIPSMQKSKKYHYHSKKMALKQRDDSSAEKVHAPLITSNESTLPKIVLVSTPLTLQQDLKDNDTAKRQETLYMNNNFAQTPIVSQDTPILKESSNNNTTGIKNNTIHHSAVTKNGIKKMGTTVHVSSLARKPEKLNIGVDKGVAFILGSKTKSPYFNTFGQADSDSITHKNALSNRKWVVNVGNFLDDEITLVLMGNNFTITGFRQPSLNFPEGQTVSETIPLPPEFDVHNLRIYRAKHAQAFLIIQEKQ